MGSFRIIAMGLPATTGEWLRAKSAPEGDLPPLTEAQKRSARAFRQSDQDYSRGLLLKKYAKEREEGEGRLLGERVAALLEELGQEYRLRAVARRGESGWHVLIEHPIGVQDLLFGSDVKAEMADRQAFREKLILGLGRLDALQVAS